MAIIVGGGGGGVTALTMPYATVRSGSLFLKEALATTPRPSNAIAFYQNVELDLTEFGMDSATLQVTADTTKQEVINLSGQSGVLINVVTPRISVGGATVTVEIIADGDITTIVIPLATADDTVGLIGDRLHLAPQSSTAPNTYGGGQDPGWFASGPSVIMLTPPQVIERALHGIPYNNTLVVSVQGSSALTVGSTSHKAVVTVTTFKPEGL